MGPSGGNYRLKIDICRLSETIRYQQGSTSLAGLGQSVREPELVLLHQLTVPPVTISTYGCALGCLTEAVPLVLAVPNVSLSLCTYTQQGLLYSIYLWGSYEKQTVTISRSECPHNVLVPCHS